jgi:hypothetical protein
VTCHLSVLSSSCTNCSENKNKWADFVQMLNCGGRIWL